MSTTELTIDTLVPLLVGLVLMILSLRKSHISSSAMGGSKPLYPAPPTARVVFFILGALSFALGLVGLLRRI